MAEPTSLLDRLRALDAEAWLRPWRVERRTSKHASQGDHHIRDAVPADGSGVIFVGGEKSVTLAVEVCNALPALLAVVEAAEAVKGHGSITTYFDGTATRTDETYCSCAPHVALREALAALKEEP